MKNCRASVISGETVCAEMRNPQGPASSHILNMDCPEIARTAKPGQFAMLDCGPDHSLRRPLSIHNVNGDTVSFYFTSWEGHATGWLAQRQPGDEITILGPLGHGFTINEDAQNLLLVGGGMGTAPLRFLAETAFQMDKTVVYIIGSRTAGTLNLTDLLAWRNTCRIATATEDGTGKGAITGLVTDLLPEYIDEANQVFICGPLPMYRAIAARRRELLKDKPTQVSLETRMGCGVGGCLSCSVKTTSGMQRVCKDGPVFDFDEVVWDSVRV